MGNPLSSAGIALTSAVLGAGGVKPLEVKKKMYPEDLISSVEIQNQSSPNKKLVKIIKDQEFIQTGGSSVISLKQPVGNCKLCFSTWNDVPNHNETTYSYVPNTGWGYTHVEWSPPITIEFYSNSKKIGRTLSVERNNKDPNRADFHGKLGIRNKPLTIKVPRGTDKIIISNPGSQATSGGYITFGKIRFLPANWKG